MCHDIGVGGGNPESSWQIARGQFGVLHSDERPIFSGDPFRYASAAERSARADLTAALCTVVGNGSILDMNCLADVLTWPNPSLE